MTRLFYYLAKHTYRNVKRIERIERDKYVGSPEYTLRQRWHPTYTKTASDEMLAGFSVREQLAITARPATADELRIQRGPKAMAIFNRYRMPLNKIVVLRRAIRESAAHDAMVQACKAVQS